MRAIVVATGDEAALCTLKERYPAPMLPLLDRPFLQHVVERLITEGIQEFDFVLSHLPEKIESWLGDGSRWGQTFRYHLARHPDRPYNIIKAIAPRRNSGPILLVQADRLLVAAQDDKLYDCLENQPESREAQPPTPPGKASSRQSWNLPVAFAWRDDETSESVGILHWTGWAWVSPEFIKHMPANLDLDQFAAFCMEEAQASGQVVEVREPLSVQTPGRLLRSQCRVLSKEVSGLMADGREIEPGVWVSRNVSMPPTVAVVPPVYLGANCRIGQHVELGPNAVIGDGSVLDNGCSVRDALVCPRSFVGESLELADVVVDKNCLLNVRLDTTCYVSERFVVGAMHGGHIHDILVGLFSRLCAVSLLAVTWPILLLTAGWLRAFRYGPVLRGPEFVRLPAPSEPSARKLCRQWSFLGSDYGGNDHGGNDHGGNDHGGNDRGGNDRGAGKRVATGSPRHFVLEFLPSLVNIAKGELHFVGTRPRTNEQIEKLPRDWRELVLCSKAGIVTEAFIQFGDSPRDEEAYSADAFYSVSQGIRSDLKLLLRYLWRVLFGRAVSANLISDVTAELQKGLGRNRAVSP